MIRAKERDLRENPDIYKKKKVPGFLYLAIYGLFCNN